MVLFYGMTLAMRGKEGILQQNYNVIDEVNLRVDANDSHTRRCKEIISCYFSDNAKNNITSKIVV